MHPEVQAEKPVSCPKCGMALEPVEISSEDSRTEYACPMHPEIVRDQPGNCPICGMALEPRNVSANSANPELANMTRRFWVAVALTLPLLAVMVSDILPGHPLQHLLRGPWLGWIEFALAAPVILWAGWPFFQRGWASVVHRSPNMFTLIANRFCLSI
jgi:Cu+-exporting ATPase